MEKYRALLDAARADRAALVEQRNELLERQEHINDEIAETEKQIVDLEATMTSLCRMCGVDPASIHPVITAFPLRRAGLTEAIRAVMKPAIGFMTAVDVRDRMLENKFDNGKYDNLLASVHVTLKRLAASEELLKGDVDGKAAYKINPKYIPRIERIMPPMASPGPAYDLSAAITQRIMKDKR